MLIASPVMVQIIAWETPLAMARASAEPRNAIESKTSSMPPTVPTRPRSGDSGTSTRSSGKLDVMPTLSREIIARRIFRASHELRSVRAFHCASIASASRGRIREKYQ
jgi:hypothetical protein